MVLPMILVAPTLTLSLNPVRNLNRITQERLRSLVAGKAALLVNKKRDRWFNVSVLASNDVPKLILKRARLRLARLQTFGKTVII